MIGKAIIIPADKPIFFRVVGIPPTSQWFEERADFFQEFTQTSDEFHVIPAVEHDGFMGLNGI